MSVMRSLPRVALGSVPILAALYFGLSPRVATGIYTKMLFNPYRYPEGDYKSGEIAGVEYEDIYFDSYDETRLHGWYFHQGDERQTVILNHGNTGNIAGRPFLLEGILKSGVNLFAYDYRGYGRSEGKPSVGGVIDDACAAYDWIIERGAAPKKVVLYGESLGAAVTCQAITRKSVSGIILQSGFASLPKIGKEHVPLMNIYPASLFPQPLLDSTSVLAGDHPPVLFLHGAKDAVVPLHHSEQLYELAKGDKTLMVFPDAQHADIPSVAQEQFVESIREFLTELCFF